MALRFAKSLCAFLALGLAFAAHSTAAEFYVSPIGRAGAAGSAADPWSLATALSHPAAVRPGDTIWLRGGMYRGGFTSRLTGTPAAPIKVRQYPGERATLDGGSTGSNVLSVQGGYTWYWGFEVMSSDPARQSSQSGGGATDIVRGTGVAPLSGAGHKFINMVVHDNRIGFALFSSAADVELYGSLSYYNGFNAQDQAHGPGVYTQNTAPSVKRFVDNIIFRNFSIGVQAYGSTAASLDGFYFEGNTIFRSGDLTPNARQDLLVGGEGIVSSPTIIGNFLYEQTGAPGSAFHLGYIGSGSSQNAVVRNNYFACGSFFNNPVNMTLSGNTFGYGTTNLDRSPYPSNTYLDGARPTGTKVFVRPNAYEPGRANITVFNWSLSGSVDVNVSSVLPAGSSYEVRNAQNFFGPPVASGVYNGGTIRLPMAGLSVAAPVGWSTPPPTGPEFNAFVLLKTSGATPPAPTPPPPTPTPPPPPPTAPPSTPTPGFPSPTATPGPPSGTPPPPASTPTPWVPPPPPPPPPPATGTSRLTVPLAGHVTGVGGIVFVTDLQIENPTGSTASGNLFFMQSGTSTVRQVSISLAPGQTANYFDVVGNRFGLVSAVGALRLETSGAPAPLLRMTSRTYARVGGGTFGQAVSGERDSESSASRYATGLVRSADLRTNLGAVNATSALQRFQILLYGSDGTLRANPVQRELAPGNQTQWSLTELFPSVTGKGLTAEFRPVSGFSCPLAYAAVVDNLSGDPTYFPAIRPSSLLYLPGVARVTGLGMTLFSSDISFANAGDSFATVTVTFLERERDNTIGAPSVTFALGPRETRQFDDALAELFGRSETYGALKIVSSTDAGILVSERISTASTTTGGTVGQQVDPVTASSLLERGSLLGLRQDSEFRSNVGLFNPAAAPASVHLALKSATGETIATTSVSLPPASYVQKSVAALFPGAPPAAGQVYTVAVDAGSSRIFPFATIVDNVSQDLTFSPGLK